ncbi:16S rRNA (guanine(966)-N(2))-methyltransferase RsmD [Novispirillum itersonii]|uniref:16S rRNA (Guanine966-N2)-methyltransferase n=1 Tax=Novispirillum itersonii TaxID=189 RepID=A0A7W9ZGN3_NOVIT|nr:16S rRNA (guanine(966)-N(2))-methyltransferase RsmD [Novispirillum itersonii]MBB6209709.1 16S rRNA (guanine966-N2)-methyltransferase [Novispirillum itersonii]
MRIVGGRFRGKLLTAPEGRDEVRPTSDRAREAVFNVLLHRFQGRNGFMLSESRVLDVFAGTGALGLEALSRGARHVTFLERGPQALQALKANIRSMRADAECAVIAGDALKPPQARQPVSLVFLDPPYAQPLCSPVLTALAEKGWLAPGAVAVAETARDAEAVVPPGFTVVDTRDYGKARVTFLVWQGSGISPA